MKKIYIKLKNLNEIYMPLIDASKKCQELLKKKKLKFKTLWANNHYEKFEDEFICELYPIPIIEIENMGDIGFNITGCFYEGYFNKRQLLNFDFTLLRNKDFSLYGEKTYLEDIYNSQFKNTDIIQAIKNSKEKRIAISFNFNLNEIENIINVLIKLTA